MKRIYKTLAIIISLALVACGDPIVASQEIESDNSYNPCSLTLVESGGTGADPLLDYQWYLKGDYANVTGAWDIVDGDIKGGGGIQIGVVDDALQTDHEDLNSLESNGDNASINAFFPDTDEHGRNPYPVTCTGESQDAHGTSVAGIIAAKGDNGIGIKGVAYNARVWGANLIQTGSFGGDALGRVFSHRVANTAVMSNSWGDAARTILSNQRSGLAGLIDEGLKKGPSDRGISYVFAAGNDGENAPSGKPKPSDIIANSEDRSSYSALLNHHGIIVVGAVGADHIRSTYSEYGPNLWISGYSNTGRMIDSIEQTTGHLSTEVALKQLGLPTLDLSGDAGYNEGEDTFIVNSEGGGCTYIGIPFNFGSPRFDSSKCNIAGSKEGSIDWSADKAVGDDVDNTHLQSYHRYFTGTSAATPLVSGVVALVRAAKPELTWRDVKLILAESAKLPAATNSFSGGGPRYTNSSSYYNYSEEYGFGIVDAAEAVELAKKWTPSLTGEPVKSISDVVSSNTNVRFVNPSPENIDFIEYVQVEIQAEQNDKVPNFGQLSLTLTSPNRTVSTFAKPHNCVTKTSAGSKTYKATPDCPAFKTAFIFGSAKYLGEDPDGDWKLTAEVNGAPIDLNWRLIIYGHQKTN